jgi:DNA (cytosine-5)-methyltransferase 1
MGYHRAGFDVVGVDIEPQPHYPFRFYQLDAVRLLLEKKYLIQYLFQAIHASPPCQAYSSATPAANRDKHPDLVAAVRDLLQATGLPYVIENVVGAPLQTGFILCGSMFGLKVRRHRLFESSVLIMPPTCDHRAQGTPLGVYGDGGPGKSTRPSGGGGTKADRRQFGELMEMPWATPEEIVQAIPPAYTEYIGAQLVRHVRLLSDEGKPEA